MGGPWRCFDGKELTMAAWDRPLVGRQDFKGQVWCCGRTDEASLLSEIVGWMVGCHNAEAACREVEDLKRRGFITTRRHIAPAGEWDAYALTEAGFDRLAQIGYGDMHDAAVMSHRWYAANAAGFLATRAPQAQESAS
jgi:hypothetical protein